MPLYPVVTQVQFVWRPGNKDKPMVGQGPNAAFKSGLRTATRRLHTDPFQPVARRIRFERKDATPVHLCSRHGFSATVVSSIGSTASQPSSALIKMMRGF